MGGERGGEGMGGERAGGEAREEKWEMRKEIRVWMLKRCVMRRAEAGGDRLAPNPRRRDREDGEVG